MDLSPSFRQTGGFDFIITGAGCAGLSLAMHLIQSGKFHDKKILLLDQNPKQTNDRTWCFWEKESGLFESIVFKQWQRLLFYGDAYSSEFSIAPYFYKMIRGIDFYNYCFKELSLHNNISVVFEKVEKIFSDENETGVIVNGEKINCQYLFNSILFNKPPLKSNEYWMLQHFKGWIIETGTNEFDAGIATLMDFNISQQWGTAFCYVLPFSSNRAMVEYTLFSPQLLKQEQYDEGLASYIKEVLKIGEYKILDEEFGIIPMTNYQFPAHQNNIINIGTAGGQTKGSSGYTFNFIQKHSRDLVNALSETGKPFISRRAKRFHFYDSVLLQVLHDKYVTGKTVFTDLFKRNEANKVLQFLDNETSVKDELKIISTLPIIPFTKAAIKQLF